MPARKADPKNPLPATGPYVIMEYRAGRVLRLRRNSQFLEWSQSTQPDGYLHEIVFDIGGTPDDAVRDVIRGRADIFTSSQSQNVPSKDRLAAVKTRHASQVHTNPQASTIGLFLNTRVAPFDRTDVRRAISYAADRAAAVEPPAGATSRRPPARSCRRASPATGPTVRSAQRARRAERGRLRASQRGAR
ncbi:MAG: ABC transporter substrate-binding protein [Gaiellaceae bacterium]